MKNIFLTSIFLILVLTGGLLYPTFRSNQTLDQEVEVLTNQFKTLEATVKTLGEQSSASNKTGRELLKTIPPVLNQAEIIRDVTLISTQSGFAFPRITFSKGVDSATAVSKLTMQLVLEGPFDNITNLLQQIEGNDPFLALENLQVKRLSENDKIARLSVSLSSLALR